MLPLSIRPLATRATIRFIAPIPIRATNSLFTPFCFRTITTATESLPEDAGVAATSDAINVTIPGPTNASNPGPTQPAAAAAAPETAAPLPYYVGRNGLNNLSVYHKIKRGGNRKLTHLKRGEGDLKALKEDIREALDLKPDEISINNVTKHIVIKGHRRQELVDFLRSAGF